jgi:hypothetical protein
MIERLMIKAERYDPQTDCVSPTPPRLSMLWYRDPMTGKLAADWISEAAQAAATHELPEAA